MPSEAPSRATRACPAAELVWVAAGFDRACGVRRLGARWRLRAGLFASPVSAFAALFACLLVCLLAIVFVLWIRTTPVAMPTPPQARRSGARRGGDQEEAVDMDSNASFAGEVERNVSRDNDFLLCGKLHQTRQLVLGQFPAQAGPL